MTAAAIDLAPVVPAAAPRVGALRLPSFWLALALFALGAWCCSPVVLEPFAGNPTGATLAAVLCTLHGLALVAVLRWLGRPAPQPRLLLAAALAWGGLVAFTLASLANLLLEHSLHRLVPPALAAAWDASIVTPIVEETAKGLGVVVIMLLARHRFRAPLAGLLYGGMAGVGFEVVENFDYAIKAAAAHGMSVAPVVDRLLQRAVVVPGQHVVYSAVVGAGVGWACRPGVVRLRSRVGVALLGLAGGWAVHALWNSPWVAGSDSPVRALLVALLTTAGCLLFVRRVVGAPCHPRGLARGSVAEWSALVIGLAGPATAAVASVAGWSASYDGGWTVPGLVAGLSGLGLLSAGLGRLRARGQRVPVDARYTAAGWLGLAGLVVASALWLAAAS